MLLQRPVLLLLLLSVLGTVMASKQKGGIGTKLGAKRTEVEALKGNLKVGFFMGKEVLGCKFRFYKFQMVGPLFFFFVTSYTKK